MHSTEIKKIMIEIKVSRNYEIPDERWMIVVFFFFMIPILIPLLYLWIEVGCMAAPFLLRATFNGHRKHFS